MSEQHLASRSELPPAMTWDLGSLYADDAAWEVDFAAFRDARSCCWPSRAGSAAQTSRESNR